MTRRQNHPLRTFSPAKHTALAQLSRSRTKPATQVTRQGRAGGRWRRYNWRRPRRLAAYLKPQLLVMDDFDLNPLPSSGPADLYDVINGRYERGSILLTSNRAPAEWPEFFGDPLLASVGHDHLADRAIVLTITGASYRLSRKEESPSVTV